MLMATDVHNAGMTDLLVCCVMLTMMFMTSDSKAGIAARSQCVYQGEIYREGQSVTVNCTNCTCTHGAMNCNQIEMECHKDPECILYETIPGKCCPECVEWGCHHEGAGYPRGARIPAPNCHYCFCPWEGGNRGAAVCTKVQCPSAHCVDGTVPDGRCCPACPNGSNCWMGDLLIPRGKEIWISPCRSCACQQEVENGYVELKAKCSWRFEQKTCPYGK